ncbi:hypothetical protein B0H16DRAFT_1894516 [Mycena metata]|uniref:Uncharacterized protein n=1 Tax=Mycena metata TaxID=1033252 RepID=A0AAD7MPN8_9AGAR|nr:hypothetical protein B0H16DRAFT_1894516 [Mycena metata]
MSVGSPSKKRHRGASQNEELPPWECDPSYGIVHPSGCSPCRSYISHVSDAKRARSSSVERAFKHLDDQLDTYFFDGVAEGRRRQRADDHDRLRDLDRARSDAVATVGRLRNESRDTKLQLSLVKTQLRLAQVESDTLRKRLEFLTTPGSENSSLVEGMLSRTVLPIPMTPPRFPLQTQRILLNPPQYPKSHLRVPESSSASKPEALIYRVNLPPRPTAEVIASSSSVAPDLRRSPKTLRQLQYLMNKAHQPGNDECLAKVKMLCAEAHQTRREDKTELQRYILANWRNPEPSAPSSACASPPRPPPLLLPNQPLLAFRANNPRMDDPVEVWHAYLTTHQGSWPRGVRRQADGSPHMGDLKASRTVARLRPLIGDTTNTNTTSNGGDTARNEFMACVAQLFACAGMYRDLLRRNALSVAPVVSYKPYRATAFSVTPAEVARHFAAAGITVAEAEAELEPWAQEYQAAVVFPTGSIEPRHPKPHHINKSPNVYRSRVRQYDPEDRFGWR